MEAKFDSAVIFMDSMQCKDLMDNYNTDSKKETKNGDIVRTWVCKFSKQKRCSQEKPEANQLNVSISIYIFESIQ